MKIWDRYRPEKCVLKADGSEALKTMFVERAEGDRGVLSATDGKVLVRIPVQLDPADKEGGLSVDALTQAREYPKDGEYEIKLGAKAEIHVPELHAEHARFNFLAVPKYGAIFPKTKPRAIIAFDVSKLKAIADAMGDSRVILEIRDESSAIVVRPIDSGHEIGLLIPMECSATAKEKQKVMK